MKFFLFTFAGSALTFLGLVAIVLWHAGYLGTGAAWRGEYAPKPTFNISQLSKDLAERGRGLFDNPDRSAARGLIDLANARGGHDNITVVVARIR